MKYFSWRRKLVAVVSCNGQVGHIIVNKVNLLSITFFAEIEMKQEKLIKSIKIDTHNFLGDRFSSIPDINRLIIIIIHYID